jgi:hypothetical protein
METLTGTAIGLKTKAVALLWADEAPEDAIRFKSGRWGCVLSLFAAAASKGRTGAFDQETYGCWGGGTGLGFGDCYQTFPGGVECFCRFLADGNDVCEQGRAIGQQLAAGGGSFADDFLHGEKYVKDAGVTAQLLQTLPMRRISAPFVVVKPLERVDPKLEVPKSVTFFVDPDQLSALVVLANHTDPKGERVAIPWGAACWVLGILAYRELDREHPRGLVGLTDLSARLNVRFLGSNIMSFTAPWPLFLEMESNAGNSFLQRETWRALRREPSAAGPAGG